MTETRIWELISLQLAGEATAGELQELKQLLQDNPTIAGQLETLQQIWNSKNSSANNKEQAYNRHLQRLSNHLSEPVLQHETPVAAEPEFAYETQASPVRKLLYWISGVAAAAAIFFIVSYYVKPVSATKDPFVAKSTVSTKPGAKSRLTLPDGSSVILNAGSLLTYDETFTGELREVQLSGEAFFDVVKDVTRPFVIRTNSIDIKVLGTAFNVRSYPNEATTETSLIRGSVEIVIHNNPDKKIILKPSEKLVINNSVVTPQARQDPEKDEPIMTLTKIHFNRKDSSSFETRWTQDLLVFDGERLSKIAQELERLYNIRIVITNEHLKRIPITGDFKNQSLDEVLEALRIAGQFNYEDRQGIITIW